MLYIADDFILSTDPPPPPDCRVLGLISCTLALENSTITLKTAVKLEPVVGSDLTLVPENGHICPRRGRLAADGFHYRKVRYEPCSYTNTFITEVIFKLDQRWPLMVLTNQVMLVMKLRLVNGVSGGNKAQETEGGAGGGG